MNTSDLALPTPPRAPSHHFPAAHIDEESTRAWALFILVLLLLVALGTSYALQAKRIRIVNETLVAIFAGAVAGLFLRFSGNITLRDFVTFDPAYFFNLLLPPIILNSGYEMKRASNEFFRNFGTILTFAFAGTFISALVTGVFSWVVSMTGVTAVRMDLLDCLQTGAVLSATDPVTILSVFSHLGVDPKLYAVIFGESMLNDAVAIVMFETLRGFRGQDLHLSDISRGFRLFAGVFCASFTIGIIAALALALLLKHTQLRRFPALESCIISLVAYSAYLFPNALGLSGIVSLLFCGLTLRHYAYDNLSRRSRRTTRYMFRVLAQLAENFIFVYLGLTLFADPEAGKFRPVLIVTTFIAVCASRYAAVFPLSALINAWSRVVMRRAHDPLVPAHQNMLFWAGLRGAVSFALASAFEGKAGASLRTAILWVVVLSVVIFGGTTTMVVERLGIASTAGHRQGRDSEAAAVDANDEVHAEDDSEAEDRYDLQRFDKDDTHWFLGLDDRWLKPFFARAVRPGERRRRKWSRHTLGGVGTGRARDGDASESDAKTSTQRNEDGRWSGNGEGMMDDADSVSGLLMTPTSMHGGGVLVRMEITEDDDCMFV